MANSKHQTAKLGLLVSSGLLIFVLAIYYLGVKQNLFTDKITVTSYLQDAAGLVPGNKIRYAGVNVGTVSEVRIVTDTSVMVTLSIDKKIREFIRKDSKVEIGQEGLMGSKLLLITPGTASSGPIEENDVLSSIRALTIDDLLQDAKKVIENSRIVSENLTEITNKLNNGKGDLAVLLNEKTVTPQIEAVSRQLIAMSQNANEVIDKIKQGDGDLGRLLNDTLITHNAVELLDNFDSVAEDASGILLQLRLFADELNEGNGLIQTLVRDSMLMHQVDSTIVNLNSGIDEIEKTSQAIRESWILNIFSGRKKKKQTR
jgi:phospholipid/cholesterol/gamma-HCH transport system substrate-binding protein